MRSLTCCGKLLALAVLLASLSGCTYSRQRAQDATDMLDLSLTVNKSWTPQFSFYFDFFNLTPLGWGNIETKAIGIGRSDVGVMDYEAQAWGWLSHGYERHGYGEFNPNDPEQARADQRDLTERPGYEVGFLGAFEDEDNLPPQIQHVQCNRILHLGYVGIQNTMRLNEIGDFFAGLVGFDPMNDDQPATSTENENLANNE